MDGAEGRPVPEVAVVTSEEGVIQSIALGRKHPNRPRARHTGPFSAEILLSESGPQALHAERQRLLLWREPVDVGEDPTGPEDIGQFAGVISAQVQAHDPVGQDEWGVAIGELLSPAWRIARQLTPQGLAEMKERMPYADLTEFAANPEVDKLLDLYTVDMLVQYVSSKLAA